MKLNEYSLTTLSDNPEYFDEVKKLIEEEFSYDQRYSFEKDFAPLINPLNFDNCYLFLDDHNKVAAHLAVCSRTLIKDEVLLPVCFIGGIATHKQHRGKALFKKLMEHALEIHKDQTGLFILWSDIENLYEKFGFYRAGGFIESGSKLYLPQDKVPGFSKTTFSSISQQDFSRLKEMYRNFNQKKFFTAVRDEKDWSIIREMDSIDLFIKRNLEGDIDRYFCVNKGRDLNNVIHEVSSLNEDIFKNLMREIQDYRVWLPEGLYKRNEIFFMAFFKIGSLEKLNSFLSRLSNNDLMITEITTEKVVFDFKLKQYSASLQDFLHYVFGPRPLEEFQSLNLSLYVCGTDSV